MGNLGLAYADLGQTERAIELYGQRLAIAHEFGDGWGECSALGNLGLAYAKLGQPEKAIEFHEQALVIEREIGDSRGAGNALGNLGLAYAVLGKTKKAIEFFMQQLDITHEIGDRRGEGRQAGWEDGCVVDESFQEGSGEAGCHGRRLADVVRSARVAVAQSTTGILRC